MKERLVKKLKTVSLFSLGFFFLSFPQSVSVSQFFGGLTIATSFPLFILDQEAQKTWKRIQNPFLFFFGIYILLFLSSLFYAENYSSFFKKFLKQSEFGDFWMLLLFPASFLIASQEKNQTILKRFLFVSASIAILFGCISLFSEVRIGKFVANGFKYAPGDRLQHFSGNIGPVKLYLPIGMMNTHLTFGGLLGLFLPGLFVDWFQSVKKKKGFIFVLKTFFVLAGFIILFFNQSRSIWLGIFVVLLLLLLKGTFSIRKNPISISIKAKILAGFFFLGLLLSSGYLLKNSWLIQRSISQIFEVHNTENQRYYIYKNTIPLIRKHWFIGIGGGNYKEFHWKESSEMIEKEEQLWYELYITPRGHAHNDLLHFLVTGGVMAGILFILFWGKLFDFFFQNDFHSLTGIPILTIGILSLFPAGFFQCYLLDDEVVLPFFAFCGIFLGGKLEPISQSQIKERINLLQKKSNNFWDKLLPFLKQISSTEFAHNFFSKTKEAQSNVSSNFKTIPISYVRGLFAKFKNSLLQYPKKTRKDFCPERTRFRFLEKRARFFKTFCAIAIPILLYWLFWIPRLNLEPLKVYNRRVRSSDLALTKEVQKNILKYEIVSYESAPFHKSSPQTRDSGDILSQTQLSKIQSSQLNVEQASLPFQVEGCLTHRYSSPPQPRRIPFSFTIYIPENSSYPPKKATITIVSRDSFDQDQLYWAHGETDLGTIQVDLRRGTNPILIPNFLLETTPNAFPEGVFFRDFRISYSDFGGGEKIDFPKLYFGKICDTVIRLTQ
ncbi:O-antigen ligase family protein [Leptospira borgpetersenii]|uniref:O-antigen ligase n=1 Tax=Leptospira borgpetersenii str. 200801926 TaxID=1193009 RepID=A0ABP2S502_LEPBO|nr:O-antigen ligase family protein [Leptospira borgpetersenii]EKP14063.1 O-antigen ligase [Leptospira borgpetersenii str. 200801926]ENO63911.1 O-antigen ligase [Leptospira borgpetersenii serovar Mini str. 201000851]